MRALSPVEAAAAFAVVGSVLAVMVPAFARNLHASRMAEPLDGLNRIAGRASALADGAPQASAYPESTPWTPESVPRAELVKDPPGTWEHPTWRRLDFQMDVAHAYAFQFESQNGEEQSRFVASARGDLDGDGVFSSFMIRGSMKRGLPPELAPLEVSREVE